jgi:hypothetical protein
MKICIGKNYRGFYIIILYNHKHYSSDKEIAKLLNIFYKEYKNFILLNNGHCDTDNNLMFKTEKDCNDYIEKLKEKYNDRLIYLALIEK